MSSEFCDHSVLDRSRNRRNLGNGKAKVFIGKKFSHAPVNTVLKRSPPLLSDCKEISNCVVIVGKCKREEAWDDDSHRPVLKSQVCDYVYSGNWKSTAVKNNFIGADLSIGYESYVPLPVDTLNSIESLLRSLKRCKGSLSIKKTTFVSLRHHIIDIIMAPFNEDPLSLLLVLLPDNNILVTVDKSHYKANGIHHVTNNHLRKICYTGFALENLLVRESDESTNSLFYSMVHGSLDDNIDMFLQAEMDSYNNVTKKYTEIKSSVNFNLNSIHHRRKLLRMWIQTSLLPSSDLLIGFRNPYSNELERLQPYTVHDIYKKFNNMSLFSKKGKFYNFNGKVAKDWLAHIFPTLNDAVKSLSESIDAKVFRLQISKDLIVNVLPLYNEIPDDIKSML